MTKAVLDPKTFSEKYTEFEHAYTGPQGMYVYYYRENDLVHFYFKFSGVTHYTRVSIEDFEVYLAQFQKTVRLVEYMS
jgi:hypothetical protein